MIERGACAFKQKKDRKNYRYLNIWLERSLLSFVSTLCSGVCCGSRL